MEIFDEILSFLLSRSFNELILFFWYFFLFDFTRYVLLDSLTLIYYFFTLPSKRRKGEVARDALFHERPLISVIAPGKNEGRHLLRLVISLEKQTYSNLELIIVDDGSDDDTPEICQRLFREGRITKVFRNNVRGGKASAANLALKYAKGKIVIHLDADSYLRSDSVEKILLPFYTDPDIGAVGGDLRVRNVLETLPASLQSLDYMKSISTGRIVNSTIGVLRMISGAYGAFRTDLLKRLGGWDVGPGLDGDLTLRIRKSGFKIVHEPDAVCYTSVPSTFASLARQRFRWDRSLVRFRVRRHGDMLNVRNRNFRPLNFLTSFDNLLFNMVLNFKWWIYFIQIVFVNTAYLKFIFTINYLLYFFSNVVEYLLVCVLFGRTIRRSELLLFFYLPLMPLYTGIFLRMVRTFAHIMELVCKSSYDDSWNPWKVSKVSKVFEGKGKQGFKADS